MPLPFPVYSPSYTPTFPAWAPPPKEKREPFYEIVSLQTFAGYFQPTVKTTLQAALLIPDCANSLKTITTTLKANCTGTLSFFSFVHFLVL